MPRIRFTQSAETDLLELWLAVAEENLAAADESLNSIQATISLLGICIFDAANPTAAYILVELKKPKLKDGKEQLKSYCNATGAPMGVWSNCDSISFYHRKDPNYFEDRSG